MIDKHGGEYWLRDVTHRVAKEMAENPDVTWAGRRDEVTYYVKDYRPETFVCDICKQTLETKKHEAGKDICISCWCGESKKAWAEHPEGITIDLREGK